MAKVGRLIRELKADRERWNRPEAAAERIRYREAAEQAYREMMERFAPLSSENVKSAMDWQRHRIAELIAARAALNLARERA